MSTFADELRAVIAKKAEQLHVEEFFRQRKREAARRLSDETASAAAALCREVFRPLLQEFYTVMEAAGVLCGGTVEQGAGSTEQGQLLPAPCSVLRAFGAPPGAGAHYEIRVSCIPDETGRIEAAVECVDVTAAEWEEPEGEKGRKGEGERSSTEQPAAWTALFAPHPVSPSPPLPFTPAPSLGRPLLALPKKTFRAAPIDPDAAGRWFAGLLKKCGQACMEANRKQA